MQYAVLYAGVGNEKAADYDHESCLPRGLKRKADKMKERVIKTKRKKKERKEWGRRAWGTVTFFIQTFFIRDKVYT
jgi:hypothetical protein